MLAHCEQLGSALRSLSARAGPWTRAENRKERGALRLRRGLTVIVLGSALLAVSVSEEALGDQFHYAQGRADYFDQASEFKAKEASDLVVVTRVPDVFDPSNETLSVTCGLQALEADFVTFVNKVKARYRTELVVLDLTTGMFEISRARSGKVKTGSPGTAVAFEIDASALMGGFPEDRRAFVQTSFRMTNKKETSVLRSTCETVVTRRQ